MCKLLLLSLFLMVQNLWAFKIKIKNESAYVKKVSDGLGIPWGFSFLSSNMLIITGKDGDLTILDLSKNKKITQKFPLAISSNGQGGLLDVAISPNFSKDKNIYFTYSKPGSKGASTALAQGKYAGNKIKNIKDLFVSNAQTSKSVHFGSRIAFIEDKIFFSSGDRGKRPLAQDLSSHAGKILRLNLDGSIPSDNPFIKTKNAQPEIWSYGHRNPQGLQYDSKRKKLVEVEHGPRGGDEINFIIKGKNYGWPVISYGKEYWANIAVGEATEKKGMLQPKKYYVPSIAPCGLTVYSGKIFKSIKGHYLMGALAKEHINIVSVDNKFKEFKLLSDKNWRIRNVVESPSGEIYFSTDNGDLYKITKRKS